MEWPEFIIWPRSSKKWPGNDIVQKIITEGFHFVPKSHDEDNTDTTWRFSFSKPEVTLLNSISSTVRNCFITFKLIVKDFLKPCCDKLRTYYFKTIFMHVLENTEPEFWKEDSTEQCFYYLLENVIEAIRIKNCPHFWLSDINLFEELTERDVNKLMKLLDKIKVNPIRYIDTSFVGKREAENQNNWLLGEGFDDDTTLETIITYQPGYEIYKETLNGKVEKLKELERKSTEIRNSRKNQKKK